MTWLDWPATPVLITRWLLVSGGLYVVVRLAIAACRHHGVPHEWSLAGDALMFGTSVLLLLGAWHKPTMQAIGDTSSFLLYSGFVGVQGTVRAMLRA